MLSLRRDQDGLSKEVKVKGALMMNLSGELEIVHSRLGKPPLWMIACYKFSVGYVSLMVDGQLVSLS